MSSLESTLLEKRIADAFDVFDNARSHEVDVRELGTIIRSLGNFFLNTKTYKVLRKKLPLLH